MLINKNLLYCNGKLNININIWLFLVYKLYIESRTVYLCVFLRIKYT